MMIVKTETSVEHKIKYLNINVSKEEIERNPDVVRLCDCDANMYAEYVKPCGDAISRQAVLDILKDKWNMFSNANDAMQESIDTIEAIPSVTPQQKTGRWIRMKAYEKWGCSECNTVFRFTFKEHDYCPNCGAKMKGVEE